MCVGRQKPTFMGSSCSRALFIRSRKVEATVSLASRISMIATTSYRLTMDTRIFDTAASDSFDVPKTWMLNDATDTLAAAASGRDTQAIATATNKTALVSIIELGRTFETRGVR